MLQFIVFVVILAISGAILLVNGIAGTVCIFKVVVVVDDSAMGTLPLTTVGRCQVHIENTLLLLL